MRASTSPENDRRPKSRVSFMLRLITAFAIGSFVAQTVGAADVTISEADYEGRPQFKVVTPSVTWFLDRQAGGFSRLIDRDGRDWIGFRKDPLNRFPESAAAGYRGIPNLVFGRDNPDAGAGHPGFDQCESAAVGENVIRTVTKSGRWAWTWTFEADRARMKMERAPSDSTWWFLYEGTIGGRWSPNTHYWGTDQGGPRWERPGIARPEFDHWRWAYFGDDTSARILFIAQRQPDALPDTLWFLGSENGGAISSSDGMVVFGLGRGTGTTAHFQGAGQEFTVGLLEMPVTDGAAHARVRRKIESIVAEQSLPTPEWEAPPERQKQGVFWRHHWYERGMEHGNPGYEKRFRVNAPETSLHPTFGKRVEARENGMMLIRAEEDLFLITAAEFYAEVWGGHPGTADKRVTVNGRSMYRLPRVGTEEGHCTYSYPAIPMKITDLVSGYNAFQFAVERGTTFWGHMIADNAAIRVALAENHPDLAALGLADFQAWVRATAAEEGVRLTLECPEGIAEQIASVDFQGWYYGYDENGNLQRLDWHGFTRNRLLEAVLGKAAGTPFSLDWDTSLVLAQKNAAVRALVRFKSSDELVYLTPATTGLEIEARPGSRVVLFAPHDLPDHFWSRDGVLKTCSFDLDVDPGRIEKAELHVVSWTGGAGTVKEYFRLAGVHYPIAEGSGHELVYSRHPVDPTSLKRGLNQVELLSDSEHHGIEIIYPGPALVVRLRE